MASMNSLVCVDDFEHLARQNASQAVIDYITNPAGDGLTMDDNRNAFKRIRLRPRVLRDVSNIDTSVTILGQRVAYPIAISPTANHHRMHPDGESATAKGAESTNTGMVLSMWSGVSLEDIAIHAPNGLRWLHITPLKNRDVIKQIVQRAENVGYKGIVVTMDRPVFSAKKRGRKESQWMTPRVYNRYPIRYGHFEGTELPMPSNQLTKLEIDQLDSTLTWEVIDWLKSVTKLPIIGKGILTAEDALEAVKHGVAGILVSNHGGRQLDGVISTIDALPEVVEAVKGSSVEVYMDGGVRNGTDVLKALALGAKAVFIGRAVLWGLACDGEEGVKRVLEILQEEFEIAMANTGCRYVGEINESLVQRRCCSCTSLTT